MNGVFVELPSFERHRGEHLTDDEFASLQQALMANPQAGDLIRGTGGLRKIRWADSTNKKGKSGGARIIYYHYVAGEKFWLFTIYGKSDMEDLSDKQKQTLRRLLTDQLHALSTQAKVKPTVKRSRSKRRT